MKSFILSIPFLLISTVASSQVSSQANALLAGFLTKAVRGAFSKELPPLYSVFDGKPVDSKEQRKRLNAQYKLVSNEIAKTPENADLYFTRGRIYDTLGIKERALADYKKAYGLGNREKKLLMALGILFYRLDDRDASISYFKRVIDKDSLGEDAYLRSGIAMLYTSGARLQFQSLPSKSIGAIPYFEKCLKVKPECKEALILLGYCYTLQKRNPDAITQFQKAIEVSPKSFSPYVFLTQLYIDEKQFSNACTVIEKAKKNEVEIPEKYQKKACK